MKLIRALAAVLLVLGVTACHRDPHIVPRPDNLRENRGFVSPPLLKYPIYACASSVVVQGFVPGARIDVFADGSPIGSAQSNQTSGQLVNVSISFTAGQTITATQTFDGATSTASNSVPVTSYTEDYPNGPPTPRIAPAPCLKCGRSLGITDVIPGAWVKIFMEQVRAGGGFDPPVQIGETVGGSYAITNTAFTEGSRVYANSGICAAVSPNSAAEIVQPEPATIPPPVLDPVHEGVDVVAVRGPGGTNPINGATLDVYSDPGMTRVGGQPTPGGAGQLVGISPKASTAFTYRATQALCTRSVPGDPATVIPCANQPPAKIKLPIPGDTQIEVTQSIPGARILVFANGVEIGDGGGPVVVLSRPIAQGETIVVLQRIGTCDSASVYQVTVDCPLGGEGACAADWPAFRHSALRSGSQPVLSALADPYQVKRLRVVWRYPQNGAVGPFRASPVVRNGRVFIGSADGHMYALNAGNGTLLWQFPAPGQPALVSQYQGMAKRANASAEGIASSAFVTLNRERQDMVVFAAPDQSVGAHLGSGRLFALRANDGTIVWTSPELARLTGITPGSMSELHEQFGYSSPLVLGDRIYGGIADHGDSPIQRGRIVAVDRLSGSPVSGFSFESTGTRGGGVWSSLAGGLNGGAIYATTGNANIGEPEPSPNHALSMLRLNSTSGTIDWKLQPVPYAMDNDPDWAAGVQLLASSCGQLALSTMKDGWSYASRVQGGSASSAPLWWQFPPVSVPFTPGDGTVHGDSRYLNGGAVWNDIFFTETGGYGITGSVGAGFGRLHALNICSANRVRWTADIPSASLGSGYQLGSPSVTRGIVFIGTTAGNLVALADPSRWPAQGSRCSRPDVPAASCMQNGYSLVPVPTVLLNLPLNAGRIRGEPVLAGGRVFVATNGGVLFMLEPAR